MSRPPNFGAPSYGGGGYQPPQFNMHQNPNAPWQQFNQRGYPTPSRANLLGNQQNSWQQRMAGSQSQYQPPGGGAPKPTGPAQYGSGYGVDGFRRSMGMPGST